MANAAEAPPLNVGVKQYCNVVVGKAATPGGVSPELFKYCSSSEQDSLNHLVNAPVWQQHRTDAKFTFTPNAVNPYSSDLLMTWFSDANCDGDQTDIYGYSGTCDSAGYKIYPDSWWSTNISSAAGFAQCNWADFTNNARNFAEGFALPVSNLGQALNDNVGIIQVYNG
ncbi:MAG: hypothetical protein J2O49_04150 [Sciscionella sp.]|nr:hypothetical protein [Sciscionella sp.]